MRERHGRFNPLPVARIPCETANALFSLALEQPDVRPKVLCALKLAGRVQNRVSSATVRTVYLLNDAHEPKSPCCMKTVAARTTHSTDCVSTRHPGNPPGKHQIRSDNSPMQADPVTMACRRLTRKPAELATPVAAAQLGQLYGFVARQSTTSRRSTDDALETAGAKLDFM